MGRNVEVQELGTRCLGTLRRGTLEHQGTNESILDNRVFCLFDSFFFDAINDIPLVPRIHILAVFSYLYQIFVICLLPNLSPHCHCLLL